MQVRNMPTRSIKQAPISVIFAQIALVVGAALFGILVGRLIGFLFFVGFAILYIVLAAFSAGRYPLDLHDGRVTDSDRAPETIKFVEELSAALGMDPPDIYLININQPQVCVCASGKGSKMRARIGITRALLRDADPGKLRVLLSLAVARIWSGHASAASPLVAFTGLFYQFAQSDWINSLPTPRSRNAETELSPVGEFLISLWSRAASVTMRNANIKQLLLESDSAALNIGQYSYRPEYIDSALRWLASAQFPQAQDPIATYNPAEVLLYLVSPFEEDFARHISEGATKSWQTQVRKVTGFVPTLDERIGYLKASPASGSIGHVEPAHAEYSGM